MTKFTKSKSSKSEEDRAERPLLLVKNYQKVEQMRNENSMAGWWSMTDWTLYDGPYDTKEEAEAALLDDKVVGNASVVLIKERYAATLKTSVVLSDHEVFESKEPPKSALTNRKAKK